MHGPALSILFGLLFFVTCSLIVVRAIARDLQPGVIGKDDRRVIDQLDPPWAAIGQVNVTGYRRAQRCTGSLVASDLVVTAAHCLMDPWRGKPYPLNTIHFVAGVRGSTWLGHSTAKCLHFPPDYEYVAPHRVLPSVPLEGVPRRAFLRDVVLIVLTEGINNIVPLEIDRAASDGSDLFLVHPSYPADRRYLLTGHFGCRLLARDQGLWFTDCDTHAASSGGPVLIHGGKI